MIDAADLIEACRTMFIRHRVEGFGGLFHVPATHEYRWLFAWDSGYHALALQHLDRAVARDELRTLYAANTTDDGLLAHEQPLPGSAARVAWIVEWLGPIYRPDGRSWLIDPPVAAYAAATLFRPELGDGTELLEAASRHLRAMEAVRRLPDGRGPVILHPLESGADASPLFDGLVDASSRGAFLAGHRRLSEVNRGADWSVERLLETADAFIVSDPIVCGWRLLALEAVADAWRRAGDLTQAAAFDACADEAAETLIRELWHDGLELFSSVSTMSAAGSCPCRRWAG
jgi:hypothetical protein